MIMNRFLCHILGLLFCGAVVASSQSFIEHRNQFRLEQRTFIRFESVFLVADVFLNGVYLGRHKGGYSAFCFEITPYIGGGEENTLSVKVDNTMQPDVAPSGTNLYPLFGGIYRPVTVFHTNDCCVSPLDYASSGVTVRPLQVSKEEAEIAVETLLNYRHEPLLQTASLELLPPKGMKGQGLYGEYFSKSNATSSASMLL